MDPLSTAAAAGMRARLESLDMLANNIANSSTTGFKVDREFYSIYADAEAKATSDGTVPIDMTVVEKPWTDFSQGTLQPTDKPLDLAISGKGFFVVKGPSEALYTRSGNFEMSGDGTVQTPDGLPLMLANGKPLKLTSNQPVEVSNNGIVRQNGEEIGTLALVNLPEHSAVKQGATRYRMADPKVKPSAAANAEIHQGKLEASNVSTPETAVRLISLMRGFETLQKSINIAAEMNRRALEEVARVGS